MANISRKQATYAFSEQKQAEMMSASRTLEIQSSGAGYQRNLFTINRPIQQPNYVESVLQGTQAGLSVYSAGQKAGGTSSSSSSSSKGK